MNADQRDARIFGVLFVLTFVTSIAAIAPGALLDWWEQTGPAGLLVAPEFRRDAPILAAREPRGYGSPILPGGQ